MEHNSSQTSGYSPLRAMPHLPWPVVVAAIILGVVGLAIHQTKVAKAQSAPYEQAQQDRMDERAEELLRQMSTKLAAADALTIEGRRSVDPELLPGAQGPEVTDITVSIRRPDMLYAEARGEDDHRKMYYNGEDFSLVDIEQGLYSTAEVPGNIDVLVRRLGEEYGFNPPVADILVADPYAHLTRNVEAGKYVGQEQVDGKTVEHLRFEEDYLTWELWVDAEQKLPVKMVAMVPGMEGNPRLVAEGIEVKIDPELDEAMFTFDPAAEAEEIPMVPVGEEPSAAR
ncbi:DUF2092 domain-containing protein [Persicimonas caeni]|uniref:DUF2092 domain-containing protein n=1 Tax=Persicimonas caeni TaxID=2292766 RepID=A0A4Y6Q1G4_PERCE|nr:DUF2092 domain-containing protein [Persicimonas caeni]QDG53825.1 DUF2092 domain-containing protein [Persicimonas caeni]QED35046.1 DUF2092 domain-containing protein [Persicimonas caeni]